MWPHGIGMAEACYPDECVYKYTPRHAHHHVHDCFIHNNRYLLINNTHTHTHAHTHTITHTHTMYGHAKDKVEKQHSF